MNIFFDGRPLADMSSGGVRRVTQGLLEALKTQGANITVVSTGTSKPSASDIHINWPNKCLSFLLFFSWIRFENLFKQKADLLFFPNLGWIGKPKIPYALVVHDLSFLIEPKWFTWKSRLWHKLIGAKRQIKNATVLFTVSETTKRDLMNMLNIPEHRIHVIPMGLHQINAINSQNQTTPYLLALGGNNPRKNTSLAKTISKKSGIPLILVGEHPWKNPSDDELQMLYANATIFLYPSWYEGFGLPLHEAARFNTPCIASTAGALPETAPKGTRFASPAKPHHWIQAVDSIARDPNNHKTITTLNTWDEAAKKIRKILSER